MKRKPTDPQIHENLLPGVPNPNFRRRRPSTWNINEEQKKFMGCLFVGKTKNDQKDVFFDAKTKLYFIEDSKSPKNKKYVKKSQINFANR